MMEGVILFVLMPIGSMMLGFLLGVAVTCQTLDAKATTSQGEGTS